MQYDATQARLLDCVVVFAQRASLEVWHHASAFDITFLAEIE